ncbi:MAG: MFS transporter, partial [Terriglobia bacterium]
VGAGSAITPPIIAGIMVRYGWRASFHVCATLGLLGGLVWLILARNQPARHPWVNGAERELIEKGIEGRTTAKAPPLPWRVLFGSKDVWSLTFSYFCYGYTSFIFFAWFFIYLTTVRGLNLKSGSYYSMLPFIAMAAGSAGGGLVSDAVSRRFGRRWGRCGVACCGMGLAAIFVAVGSLAQSAEAASVILAGGAGALYIAQSSFWSVSADIGAGSSGSLSGMMNMGAQTGSSVTAALTPVIAAHLGWTASFMIAACLCVLGALAWLAVNPNLSLGPHGRAFEMDGGSITGRPTSQ